MKLRLSVLLLSFAAAVLPSAAPAQSAEHSQRIALSALLALGRLPEGNEASRLALQGNLTLEDLLRQQRQSLSGDETLRGAAARHAHIDAFGTPADASAARTPADAAQTYAELVQRHLEDLAAAPDRYAEVIHRAYRFVVRRDAYPEEIEYWRKRDTLSYALLVGCIEDWGRRNQPGLMVTAGTPTISINSEFLTTLRLTPALAAEGRAALGRPLAPNDFPYPFPAATGRNLLAPGGDEIVTGGRIHFAAVGSPALRTQAEQ